MNLASMLIVILLGGSLALQSRPTSKPKAGTENRAPVIESFTALPTSVILCPFGLSCAAITDSPNRTNLHTNASDPDGDPLTYTYLTTAGTIEGTGPIVVWNLEKEWADTYRAWVRVEDPKGNKRYATVAVKAAMCTNCDPPPPPCPTVSVECPAQIESGKLISFVVTVTGDKAPYGDVSYRWKTDAGRIIEGKFETKMTLDLMRFPFEKVTATVSVGGYDPACTGTEASCTTRIKE